ncbi:MAG TPA: ribosomal protein L7/L12 [Candidatus Glassbacteria bacterium]|nr:ribosomal protein L7/L12 [Candidatus Glassbacteria bacterium]
MSDKKEKGLIPTEVVEIKPLEFPKCNIFLDHEPDFSELDSLDNIAGCAYGAPFAGPAGPPVEANVFLKNVGPHKIKVIVYLRSVTGRGLADLKELVETPDSLLFEQIMYCDAKEHKEKLEELGAIIELQETGWMNV